MHTSYTGSEGLRRTKHAYTRWNFSTFLLVAPDQSIRDSLTECSFKKQGKCLITDTARPVLSTRSSVRVVHDSLSSKVRPSSSALRTCSSSKSFTVRESCSLCLLWTKVWQRQLDQRKPLCRGITLQTACAPQFVEFDTLLNWLATVTQHIMWAVVPWAKPGWCFSSPGRVCWCGHADVSQGLQRGALVQTQTVSRQQTPRAWPGHGSHLSARFVTVWQKCDYSFTHTDLRGLYITQDRQQVHTSADLVINCWILIMQRPRGWIHVGAVFI